MKTYPLTTALLTMFIAASAQAAPAKSATPTATQSSASNDYGFYFKPTVGADYQFTSVDYGTASNGIRYKDIVANSLNGVNFHVGARVHKYLGFEAGYLTTESASKSNVLGTALNTTAKLEGFNFDALGYLPIDDKGKFELIGTVGVSRLKATFTHTGLIAAGSGSATETKGRIGAGAQYWLTDNINVRGIVRYQGADFNGVAKDAIVSNLGLNFQF